MRSRLAVCLLLLTAACSSDNSASSLKMPDYSSSGKINLDVKNITYSDQGTNRNMLGPIISDQFQPTITQAAQTWALQRLQAVGSGGQAVFVVRNAYVVSQLLPTSDSWFEREQGSKFIGHIEVEIDARNGERYGLATAQAERTVSLPENPTEEEKSVAYGLLLNGLMADLNSNLDTAIHEHLSDFTLTEGSKVSNPWPVPESPNQSP